MYSGLVGFYFLSGLYLLLPQSLGGVCAVSFFFIYEISIRHNYKFF
jgi:hypothetical protein